MADINEVFIKRRSIRKFKDTLVDQDKIDKLTRAALLAPSGKSTYPCEFIVIDDKLLLDKISKAKTHGARLVAGAPLAIAVAVDTSIYDVWVEDASVASTYIMLEAESLGLGCCWVQMHLRGTDDGKSAADNLRADLNLPEHFDLLSVLAIGYKNEEKDPRTDSDLKFEKIHNNRFKQR